MTPSLRDLQQAFAAAVFDDAQHVLASVRDGVFPAPRHLQIYRHNTFANLTDALAAVYPVVRRLVGDGFFDYAANEFIRRYPPRSGNLHDFGFQYADFLTAFEPARELVYLPDVARLEWAWHEAFHAADTAPIALDALAAIAPERYAGIVFDLHPSAHLLRSPYPVLRIWQVNQPGFDGDARVDLNDGAQHLLVVRRALEVEIDLLSPGEHALLQGFAGKQPLAEATGAALAEEGRFDFGAALRRHVATGTIVRFAVSD